MEGHFTQTPCGHFERNREIFRQPSEGSVIAVSLRWPLSEMWGQTGRSLIVYRVDGRGFKRPSGTHFFFCLPGVETPGYFHLSIRDMRLGVGHPPIPEGLRIWSGRARIFRSFQVSGPFLKSFEQNYSVLAVWYPVLRNFRKGRGTPHP